MDALILDFNGVIVDDEPLHFASFRDVLASEGIPLDAAAYYADYLGFEDRAAFREAFRRADRPFEARTLAQMGRELMLSAASDWPFILSANTAVGYAKKRIEDHLARFEALARSVRANEPDERLLAELEAKAPIFPALDHRSFSGAS